MYRLLLVAILSCIAISSFAKKKIALNGQTRCPLPPVEVFIDEVNKELVLDLEEGNEIFSVTITDLSGNSIYLDKIKVEDIYILPLPVIEKGEYILSIFIGGMELQGIFDIEE